MEINKQRHQTELFNYLFNNELMVNLSKYEMAIRQWLPDTGGKRFSSWFEMTECRGLRFGMVDQRTASVR